MTAGEATTSLAAEHSSCSSDSPLRAGWGGAWALQLHLRGFNWLLQPQAQGASELYERPDAIEIIQIPYKFSLRKTAIVS